MKFAPNENLLRVALIAFSVLFGILSISLLTLGIVYIDELFWPKRYIGLDFVELPTLLIVLGSVSLGLAIAGCVCARSYSRWLILSFAAILCVILCLELSVAVIAFINFEEHEGGHTKTHKAMLKQYQSVDPDTRLFFQELEDHYGCCGVLGNETNCLSNTTTHSDLIIESEISTTTEADYEEYELSSKGCAEVVNAHIQMIASEIGYFNSVLAFLQVFEIVYVILIYRSTRL